MCKGEGHWFDKNIILKIEKGYKIYF